KQTHMTAKPQPPKPVAGDENVVPIQPAANQRRETEAANEENPPRPPGRHSVYKPDAEGEYRPFRNSESLDGENADRSGPRTPAPGEITASTLGGKLLGMHLLLWSALAVALGACAVAAELSIVPDAVLCWGVSRWQYFLGKCTARSLAAATLYAVVGGAMLILFAGRTLNDLAFFAAVKTLFWGALLMAALTLIGVAIGAWCRNPMTAVAVSVILVGGLGVGATLLAGDAYSPLALANHLDVALRGGVVTAGSGIYTVAFSLAAGLLAVSAVRFAYVDL
ncbi:MAG TPA: hypothetical protein VNC50_18010, partial [Planctomycetia bacterium]|nr:hypothetical protein [Planctomycetia bacterium]